MYILISLTFFINNHWYENKDTFLLYLAGTDLPDDDYTTLVPPVKQTNGAHRKLPQVPIIIENKENDPSLPMGI